MDEAAVVFGASGGIGRALVDALVTSGQYGIVHAGMRRDPGTLPAGARPFHFDLDDERSIAEAAGSFERPPTLVIVATGLLHDAGSGVQPERSFRTIDAAAMARTFQVNTIGPALIAKYILPRLARDRRSVFAALSARVGSIGDNRLGGWHSYRASKAALNMLLANFAIEMARSHPHAIVAGLHPGTVESNLSAPFQRGVPEGKLFPAGRAAAQLLQVIGGLTPQDSGSVFAWDGQRVPW